MGKNITIFLLILLTGAAGCSSSKDEKTSPEGNIELSYQHGTDLSPVAWKNIYAVWIENQSSSFLQNLSICRKLIERGLTGTALPFWKLNKYPLSDIDEINAVTGATKANQNFTFSFKLKDTKIRKFTIYFEVDRSFEINDWFTDKNKDQPALLFKADIDLDSAVNEYELELYGWTPDENNENVIPGTPKGILQHELRYITNLKDLSGTGFGDIDSVNSAANMVKKITLKIRK